MKCNNSEMQEAIIYLVAGWVPFTWRMNAAYDTAVKRFICEFVAIIILYWPNAAVNRFSGFDIVKIVDNQLIIINGLDLVRRRQDSIVPLVNAIHIDIVAVDDGTVAAAAAATTDDDDVPIAIVSIIMIIFVNGIVNGGAISAVQMLIDVIQFAD